MDRQEILKTMKEKGIVFDGAVDLICDDVLQTIAEDAQLITNPNTGVPSLVTTYVDPSVIEILTAPTRARQIFNEVKKGDWADSSAMFKVIEEVGASTPYGDYSNGATADINVNFPVRTNYLAQIHIRYGEYEMAVAGKAAIDLVSRKQQAAANQINKDMNRMYLYGVAGKEVYGLLNEPDLPDAVLPNTIGDVVAWNDKTPVQIYDDILKLASSLFANSKGLIDEKAQLKLVVSPEINVLLGKTTDHGVVVKQMLNDYFDNLTFVVLPELGSALNGNENRIMLIASSVDGQPSGEFGYSEKMRSHAVVQQTSYWDQKFSFGTYGFILYRPFAIATMTGI